MKRRTVLISAVALVACLAPAALADSPARERELTCSDGTAFTAQQVRHGGGRPPHAWRNVTPGAQPAVFSFHSTTVTAPDGTVVESEYWDNTQGIERNHELVVCSFIIPVGPLTGHRAEFEGFFVAAGRSGG